MKQGFFSTMRKMITRKKNLPLESLNVMFEMSRNIEIRVESRVEIDKIYTYATEPAREGNQKTLPKSEKTRNFEYPPKDEIARSKTKLNFTVMQISSTMQMWMMNQL